MSALLTPAAISDNWSSSPKGLYVPKRQRDDRPVVVDLFAGCGGFSVGFKQAGWHVAAAVELDRNATATYLVNLGGPGTVVHTDEHPGGRRCAEGMPTAGTGWIAGGCDQREEGCTCARCVDAKPCEHFWMRDVAQLTGAEIVDTLRMEVGEVGAVIGGPPCQGFSVAGRRDVMDPRNSLVFEFARLVVEIRPKTFVMENVVGLLRMTTPEGIPVIDALARIFADGGFSTYDALRRSLRGMAGAGAAVRTDSARPEKRDVTEDSQPGLFDLTAGAS